MPKYNNRYEYTINRTVDNQKQEDHWLKELEDRLTKEAVQPKRVDQSMFEQINSIISGKSKYKSVEDAVADMQRRSGYLDYFNKKVANQDSNAKQVKVQLFVEHPEIENTFKNYIRDTSGNLNVPSIIYHVKAIHKNDVSNDNLWDDESLIKHIHNLNESTKSSQSQETSHNLGSLDLHTSKDDIDKANDDAWAALMPATKN